MSEISDTEVHAYKDAYSRFMQNEYKLLEKGVSTSQDPSFEATRFGLSAVSAFRDRKAEYVEAPREYKPYMARLGISPMVWAALVKEFGKEKSNELSQRCDISRKKGLRDFNKNQLGFSELAKQWKQNALENPEKNLEVLFYEAILQSLEMNETLKAYSEPAPTESKIFKVSAQEYIHLADVEAVYENGTTIFLRTVSGKVYDVRPITRLAEILDLWSKAK